MAEESHSLAVFIDFENLAIGWEHQSRKTSGRGRKKAAGNGDSLDIGRILERLVEKGKLVVKTAYADWGRYNNYVTHLHDQGCQLVEIPERGMTGKNFADIQLCVDAMDMCYAKQHVDTFVVVSGDSDFTPLVAKLKENGKTVIGVGMKESTSDLLAGNCDEFIYYEDIGKGLAEPKVTEKEFPNAKRPALKLLIESVQALMRENKDIMLASMVKDTMKRKQPQFSEGSYGYRTFSQLLEDAQAAGVIELRVDQRSGTYVVTGFADKK